MNHPAALQAATSALSSLSSIVCHSRRHSPLALRRSSWSVMEGQWATTPLNHTASAGMGSLPGTTGRTHARPSPAVSTTRTVASQTQEARALRSTPAHRPPSFCMVEYIWITRLSSHGHPSVMMRSKMRVLSSVPNDVRDVPQWSADGLSTNQADATGARMTYMHEVVLKPIFMCDDPFRGAPNKLVLCECRFPDGSAVPSDHRAKAEEALSHRPHDDLWLGFEQEYTLLQRNGRPLGWPDASTPDAQRLFLNYCGVGGDVVGRDIMDEHVAACLRAGLEIFGCNLEVLVGSCEFQLQPLAALRAADSLWMCRYILARVAEKHHVQVSFDPKPVLDADGCGMHTNVSTAETRRAGHGGSAIRALVAALAARHRQHMEVYGEGNTRRLLGHDEYSSFNRFTCGIGDRSASIRVPFTTVRAQSGYFEDRRPAANADPYLIVHAYAETLRLAAEQPEGTAFSRVGAAEGHVSKPVVVAPRSQPAGQNSHEISPTLVKAFRAISGDETTPFEPTGSGTIADGPEQRQVSNKKGSSTAAAAGSSASSRDVKQSFKRAFGPARGFRPLLRIHHRRPHPSSANTPPQSPLHVESPGSEGQRAADMKAGPPQTLSSPPDGGVWRVGSI